MPYTTEELQDVDFYREFIDQKKDSAEHHNDSKLVIKNPLKCKEDSKRFYDTFDRINIHGSIAKEIDEIRANKFSGHYVVGVHARCSNGEFLPPIKGNSKRFHGERNPILAKRLIMFYLILLAPF